MSRAERGITIDLNCDLGEDPSRRDIDLELLSIVTSANIACGGHAGDQESMGAMVGAAAARGVGVGAHPSYPDRGNFGRVAMAMLPAELRTCVREQVEGLHAVAAARGLRLRHVKPHGALYHAAMTDATVANAIADAVEGLGVVLVGQARAMGLEVWRSRGFLVAAEAFVDRRYESDGGLRARARPGAILHDPTVAAAQAVGIATLGRVQTEGGGVLGLQARTICIHSDTPGAPAVAREVRRALEAAGVAVRGM